MRRKSRPVYESRYYCYSWAKRVIKRAISIIYGTYAAYVSPDFVKVSRTFLPWPIYPCILASNINFLNIFNIETSNKIFNTTAISKHKGLHM